MHYADVQSTSLTSICFWRQVKFTKILSPKIAL